MGCGRKRGWRVFTWKGEAMGHSSLSAHTWAAGEHRVQTPGGMPACPPPAPPPPLAGQEVRTPDNLDGQQ